mmetsp:Transcript_31079/g.79256  ORF Transcript_31079/g.79256 Transcript_31079/m.79256 type:complete len:243 (+) Transcript_31079:828-1556(+)
MVASTAAARSGALPAYASTNAYHAAATSAIECSRIESLTCMDSLDSSCDRGMSRDTRSSSTEDRIRQYMSTTPSHPAVTGPSVPDGRPAVPAGASCEPGSMARSRSWKKPGHAPGYSCCSTATSVCATLLRRKGGSGADGALQSRVTQVSSAPLTMSLAGGGSAPYEVRMTSCRVWRHQNLTSEYAVTEKRSVQSLQASGDRLTSLMNTSARSFKPASTAAPLNTMSTALSKSSLMMKASVL